MIDWAANNRRVLKISIFPINVPKMEDIQPYIFNFVLFWENIFDKNKFFQEDIIEGEGEIAPPCSLPRRQELRIDTVRGPWQQDPVTLSRAHDRIETHRVDKNSNSSVSQSVSQLSKHFTVNQPADS